MMFGIFHLIPQQAFNAALVGLVIGLIAVHSRSIFPAMLFHLLSNSMALLHARKGSEVAANGVFFSKVPNGATEMLRYEVPLLLLCAIGVGFIVARLLRDLKTEQKAKRQLELKAFDAPTEATPVETNNLAAGI